METGKQRFWSRPPAIVGLVLVGLFVLLPLAIVVVNLIWGTISTIVYG